MRGSPIRVALVEDEPSVREAVERALRREGFSVSSFGDYEEPETILGAAPDLAVLDVMLPHGDGLELARRLRARRDLPIVFLTARDGIDDRLAGFALGADDYLVKPFALEELLARVRAVLRRAGRLGDPLEAGEIVVDEQAGLATRAGRELALTPTELRLLAFFVRHRGLVLSKHQLLTQVWGYDAYDPNVVEVHVSALRRKLEEHGPRLLDRAVNSLLRVELLVAMGALALAALLVLRATRAALRPLSQVIEAAERIAAGDSSLRLRPSRTDTELGSMAAAFDRMVDALEFAVEEARASDAATRRFLADASHELRTPIAALQASAETLLREQPPRPERDRLEASLARDSTRLGRLVDDLLGLARLEARPGRESVALSALATAAVEDARAHAPQVHVTLAVDGEPTVQGDADALARVLRNLLDNALAALPADGDVQVSVTQTNGHVEARVTDNGPGVPEAERERIFERFVRLDPAVTGSGLGLAIARRIARQHSGELSCDPTQSGASFTLRLPAATNAGP